MPSYSLCGVTLPFLGVALAFSLVAAESEAPAETLQADIGRAVNAAVEQGKLPGAVVLVLQGDKVLVRKAFGHRATQPEPTLMTEDTVFDLASLTKPIATGLAILLLMEEGKLDPDDLLSKFLPAFARKETEGITVAQLLLHTSGFIPDNPIGDYRDGPAKAWLRLLALNPV